MLSAPTCPDCGANPVNHTLVRLSVRFDHFTERFSRLPEYIGKLLWPALASPLKKFLLLSLEALSLTGVVRKLYAPDTHTSGRAEVLWQAATKRGIKMWEYRLLGARMDTYALKWQGKKYLFKSLPLPTSAKWQSDAIQWMDDKGKMRTHFKKENIPMAGGGVASSLTEASNLFEQLGKPVITKPSQGSRSRHTTTHIETLEQLATSFAKAAMLSPWVIVEEELVGAVHRVTLVGGKVVAVCRRDPAQVMGDGTHSVEQLAVIANENPGRSGPHFHLLSLPQNNDATAEAELIRQNVTWATVPNKNQIITLGTKTSRGSGGNIVDVTDTVHPENKILFEKIGELLGDPLVGIDFIIADMSRDWQEQKRCGVIECNSMPFIDLHHYPLEGKVQDVASKLLELNFPELSSAQPSPQGVS